MQNIKSYKLVLKVRIIWFFVLYFFTIEMWAFKFPKPIEYGFITGLGNGMSRNNLPEAIYHPIYFIAHIGSSLKPKTQHPIWSKCIVTFYNEPQVNWVVLREYESNELHSRLEFGVNSGLKCMLPILPNWYLYVSGGSGPHFFNVETIRQHKGFIFSDNFGIGTYLFPSEKWSIHVAFRLRHMSNINLWMPNNGINTFNYHVGISYFLQRH